MRRRLFTILSALSLLLCVAVVVLWVRSYWVKDLQRLQTGERCYEVSLCEGTADVAWWLRAESNNDYLRRPFSYDSYEAVVGRQSRVLVWQEATAKVGFDRFGYMRGIRYIASYARISFPCWLVLLFLSTPVIIETSTLFRRRPRSGLCPSCGYDLRATPDRCPECGREASSPSA